MVRGVTRFLSLAALAAALFSAPAVAQNGRIKGTVRDGSGGPLAGATVRAAGGGGAGRATSSADGSYAIANLAPCTITVSASLPVLRTPSHQSVEVTANGQATVDFVMQALQLQAVTVT